MKLYTQGFLLLIFSLPLGAMAQTGAVPVTSDMKTTKDAAHISSSIYPTVIPPAPMTLTRPSGVIQPYVAAPLGEAEVVSVCMASSADAQFCGASVDAASPNRSGCDTESSYDDTQGTMTEPLMVCHGKYEPSYSHSAHMAFCDVDDVGLSACLSQFANVLVHHPAAAKQVVHVSVRNSQGQLDILTTLTTGFETTEQIKREVLKARPDITIEAIQ